MNDAILILDDDPKVLETLASVLEGVGSPLIRCTEPRHALEQIRNHRPRVVITDLMMPEMTGLEMLRSVKAVDPKIQVILVTGYGTVREAVDAIRDGAFDFICKPFNARLIEAVVRRALHMEPFHPPDPTDTTAPSDQPDQTDTGNSTDENV